MEKEGEQLYERFLKGEKRAFEELVMRYADGLVCFAFCYLKDSAAAEDVAQEVFATLAFRRFKLRKNVKFKTMLFAIARNKSIDKLRKRRRMVPIDDLENVLTSPETEDGAVMKERDETIYRCLQRLKDEYRDVLWLVYLQGMTIEETSFVLKKSVKQIYNLLARAKNRLKEELISEGFDNEDF